MKKWNSRRIRIISETIIDIVAIIIEFFVVALEKHYKISSTSFLITCIISSIVLSTSISYSYIPQHSILQNEVTWNKHLDPFILSLIPVISSIITIIPLFSALHRILPQNQVMYMGDKYVNIPGGKIPLGVASFGILILGLSFFIGYLEKYYIHDKIIKEKDILINKKVYKIINRILSLLYLLYFKYNNRSRTCLHIEKEIKNLLNLQDDYHYDK